MLRSPRASGKSNKLQENVTLEQQELARPCEREVLITPLPPNHHWQRWARMWLILFLHFSIIKTTRYLAVRDAHRRARAGAAWRPYVNLSMNACQHVANKWFICLAPLHGYRGGLWSILMNQCGPMGGMWAMCTRTRRLSTRYYECAPNCVTLKWLSLISA